MTSEVGTLGQQGQGDRAGAGADLVHAGALGQLDPDLDQQLGLAARPEHALVDGDLEPAEGGAAEDVGDRLAVGAARHPLLDRGGDVGGDLAGAGDRELLRLHAHRVGDQHFGVAAGAVDAGGGEALRRRVEHGADGARRGPLLTLNVDSRHLAAVPPKLWVERCRRSGD